MKWFRDHDPRFLTDLRNATRARAKARRLKLRRPIWSWRRYVKVDGLVGLALLAILGLTLSRQSNDSEALNQGAVEAVLSLVALFLVAVMERHFSGMLNHWSDIVPALRLPVNDSWIVRRQWGRGLERFPLILFAAFLGALSVSLSVQLSWGILAGCLLFAVVLSGVAVTLATWLAGSRFGVYLSVSLWGLLIFLWFGSKFFPDLKSWLVLQLNQHGEWLTLVLPTGWVVRPFYRGLAGGPASNWISLVPAAVLVASGTAALRRLTGRWRIRDQALLAYASQIPDDATDEFRREVTKSLTVQDSRSLGELRETVLSRRFLSSGQEGAPVGWIERLIWRCWSQRERHFAEIAFAAFPQWTKSYVISGGVLILSVSAGGMGARSENSWLLVGWLMAGAALVQGLTPLSPVVGRLQNSWVVGQGTVTALGLFPLSFPELCRWSLKAARIRLLLGIPQALGTGALVGFFHPDLVFVRSGMEAMSVALISVLGLQPLWLAGNLLGRGWPGFAARGRFWRRLVWFSVGVAWLGLAGAGVVITVLGGYRWGIGCSLVAVAVGTFGLRWISGVVGRGGIEMVILPQVEV